MASPFSVNWLVRKLNREHMASPFSVNWLVRKLNREHMAAAPPGVWGSAASLPCPVAREPGAER